jgi:hypothetical protein
VTETDDIPQPGDDTDTDSDQGSPVVKNDPVVDPPPPETDPTAEVAAGVEP